MTLYARLRTTATRLLKDYGKAITLQRTVQGAYDASTGGTSTTSETASGNGVLVNYRNQEIDGTTIKSSDRRLIYAGDQPKIDDQYSGWRVVSVNPIDPDETGAIIYSCQMRR